MRGAPDGGVRRLIPLCPLLAALTSCLIAVGCGDGADRAAQVANAGKKPAREAILRRGNGGDPATLDPQRSGDHYSDEILRDLYEGLVTEAPDGTLVPGVARSWTISEDARTYRFDLRPEAKWSDGTRVTAAEFVDAFRTAVDPATAAPAADLLRPIARAEAVLTGKSAPTELGVKAISPGVLEIEFERPCGYCLSLLTHPIFSPRHAPVVGADRHPAPVYAISNGPYQFVEWVPNSRIEVRRNPQYWNAKSVRIDVVRYFPVASESDEFTQYRAGQLDITAAVPVNQLDNLRRERPGELRMSPYLGAYFLGFNQARPPFAHNAELRRALSLAIDREMLADRLLLGTQRPAWTLVPSGNASYAPATDPAASMPAAERLKLARELFKKATSGRTEPLRIRVIYGNSELVRSALVAIAAMWKDAFGLQLDIVTEEFRVFLDTQKHSDDFELVRMAWIADFNDPISFLQLFRSDDPVNIWGYRSREFDRLISEAERTPDPAVRMARLHDAEQRLLADAAFIPLFHMQSKRLVSPRVEGFSVTPLNRIYSKHLALAD